MCVPVRAVARSLSTRLTAYMHEQSIITATKMMHDFRYQHVM